jgi:hypothetical protein
MEEFHLLVNELLNQFEEDKNVFHLEKLYNREYCQIFELISKLFLSSKQHQLRISGLKILHHSKKKKEEIDQFINLIHKFSFDDKWQVRDSLTEILSEYQKISTFSNFIILFLCEDDIDIVRENAKELITMNLTDLNILKMISFNEKESLVFNLKIIKQCVNRNVFQFKELISKLFEINEMNGEAIEILKNIFNSIFELDQRGFLDFLFSKEEVSLKELKFLKFIFESVKSKEIIEEGDLKRIIELEMDDDNLSAQFDFISTLIPFTSSIIVLCLLIDILVDQRGTLYFFISSFGTFFEFY